MERGFDHNPQGLCGVLDLDRYPTYSRPQTRTCFERNVMTNPQPKLPPDIVLPVNQPLPKPPGMEWWIRHIANQGGTPEEMPIRTREWLEAECLRVANREIEVRGQLVHVRIRRLYPAWSGPNWEVAEFVPPLPPIAEKMARIAISILTGTYALA